MAKGLAQGMEKGLAQGFENGHVEGKAEGRMEERIEVARNMKSMGIASDVIIKVTGLTIKDVENL